AETNEIDGASRAFAGGEDPCEFQNCYATGSIVVSTIEDFVVACRLINAEMVQVSAEHDRFAGLRTFKYADHVPGCAGGDRNALDVIFGARVVSVAARLKTKLAKLRGDVFGSDSFVDCFTTAALHRIACKKAELGANILFLNRRVALCGNRDGDET